MKEVEYLFEKNPAGITGSKPLRLHPDDVLNDPRMMPQEKRAVLADWASDARAVTGSPGLRQLDSGAVICVDLILGALARINERGDPGPDDDPPPAAAAALPVPDRSDLRPAA
jgi:hypothetical protein